LAPVSQLGRLPGCARPGPAWLLSPLAMPAPCPQTKAIFAPSADTHNFTERRRNGRK